MAKITDRQKAKYGIITVGGELPVVVFEPEVPHYFDVEDRAAQAFVDSWVTYRVSTGLRRGPLLCATGVNRVITVTSRFDYGHFVALRNEADRLACYDAYNARADAAFEPNLTREVFLSIFNPRPFANATLVITSDGKMLCVRRSPAMDLHPSFLHCSGGKVTPVKDGENIDLAADALNRVHIETGIPLELLMEPIYLGCCGNEPREVIALFMVYTTLTAEQVTKLYKRAQEPDGGVEWFDYNLRTIRNLLRRKRVTPSFRALLYILRCQKVTENRLRKKAAGGFQRNPPRI